ncbi:MAG: isoprenylcysteine carboxylmethyltransferase family protein [Elusimicrobia bacterium]|nr:isoprenylcysteine carboxylmethyltransferase family protein [Elusimicrobiota bacterium]
MRHDPERFVTFVLGAFALMYYFGVGAQIVRVWRRIGRSPVMWGTTPLEKVRVLGAFLWPLPVLLWAHCPECFRGLPRFPFLESWPIRLIGLFLVCLAGAVVTIAYGELGDFWRIGVDPGSGDGFVRTGIYGSVRHPVYAGLWACLLGFFLLAPNLLFAILWAIGSSAASAQADFEDRHLTQRFGKAYRDYSLITGKFFPLWF